VLSGQLTSAAMIEVATINFDNLKSGIPRSSGCPVG
jgi:hypothetical protein